MLLCPFALECQTVQNAHSVLGLSSELRKRYALRYALSVGSSAGAGALLQSGVTGTNLPIAGLAIGAVVGALAFRKFLRPLSWPRLHLSRSALYVVQQRRRALVLPWEIIERVEVEGTLIRLILDREVEAPGAGVVKGVAVDSEKLGLTPETVARALESARADPASLPEDALVRGRLGAR